MFGIEMYPLTEAVLTALANFAVVALPFIILAVIIIFGGAGVIRVLKMANRMLQPMVDQEEDPLIQRLAKALRTDPSVIVELFSTISEFLDEEEEAELNAIVPGPNRDLLVTVAASTIEPDEEGNRLPYIEVKKPPAYPVGVQTGRLHPSAVHALSSLADDVIERPRSDQSARNALTGNRVDISASEDPRNWES